jgi:hypothetical protein
MAQQPGSVSPDTAQLLRGLTQGRRRFRITDPRTRQTLIVEGLGEPPTLEEARDIFAQTVGGGRYTRGDLSAAGGSVGSIGGSIGLGTVAKKIPQIALLSGLGGGIGEAIKQVQTPDKVGRWDITNIQEPALMGATTIEHDPRSLASRAKMVGVRGAEEAGLDLLGASAMQLPRGMARMAQSFALSGQPALQTLKAQSPGLMEASLRNQPPVAPQSMPSGRKWLPTDPLVTGRGAGAEQRSLWGTLRENAGPAQIRESTQKMDNLLATVNAADVPLEGTTRGSFFSEMLRSNPGVRGKETLDDFLQSVDDINLTQIKQDARELGGDFFSEMGRFWDNYISNPRAKEAYEDMRGLDFPDPVRAPGTPVSDFQSGFRGAVPQSPTGPRTYGDPALPQWGEASSRQLPGGTASAEGSSVTPLGSPAQGEVATAIPTSFMGTEVNLPRSPRRTAGGDISLRQAFDDKRFLEDYMLGPLYEGAEAGRRGPAVTRTTAILKALRDALDTRIHQTLELGAATGRMRPDAADAYDQINRQTQEMNRLFKLVQQSPAGYSGLSTVLAPLSSLLARGTEKASRFGYPFPQTAARLSNVLSTEATPPETLIPRATEEEIVQMAPTRENAARLALDDPDRDRPGWLQNFLRELRGQTAEGPSMAGILRRGTGRKPPVMRGPMVERPLDISLLGLSR